MTALDTSNALYASQKQPALISPSSNDEKLREQTDAFESIMVKILLDTALKMEDSLYPKETGHEIYQSLYKEQLSQSLSGGFGYSELLFNYLKEQQALPK